MSPSLSGETRTHECIVQRLTCYFLTLPHQVTDAVWNFIFCRCNAFITHWRIPCANTNFSSASLGFFGEFPLPPCRASAASSCGAVSAANPPGTDPAGLGLRPAGPAEHPSTRARRRRSKSPSPQNNPQNSHQADAQQQQRKIVAVSATICHERVYVSSRETRESFQPHEQFCCTPGIL